MSVSRMSTAPATPADVPSRKGIVAKGAVVKKEPKRKPAAKQPAVKAVAEVDIFVHNRSDFRVLTEAGLACTAMLNQTNLAENNNKFFLIQALERVDGSGFASWFRWGRVGYSGQTNLQEFDSAELAIDTFTQKFYDKTLNEWSKTVFKSFQSFARKYTLLPVDTLTESAAAADGTSAVEVVKVEYEPTRLDSAIFDLVKLISSKEMFETELKIAGLDLTRMPLGRISAAMISEGFKILQQIETELLGKNRREIFADLSGKFYTVIPHNFGFAKAISFVINSFDKLRDKTELLESLENVKNGIKSEPVSVDEKFSIRPNPVDDHYARLGCALETVPRDSQAFALIERYKQNTQGETHGLTSKITNVYQLQSGEPAVKGRKKTKQMPTKMLLWHGSRLTNWMSILTEGLKIAPPEAPHTGYMFGKGIYTADCFSKAANYCFVTDTRQRTGLVVLCEVDLGTSREVTEADCDAGEKLGRQFHSTKGVGKFRPHPDQFEVLDDTIVPCGELRSVDEAEKDATAKGRTSRRLVTQQGLLYNEYIVYDPTRVRMKYLVELEFTR